MVVGSLVAGLGFVLFAGVLFSHGGLAKSEQFRVIGEIMRGRRGGGARLVMAVGILGIIAGGCIAFSGVAALDRARAERCREHCRAAGFERARVGPNRDRDPRDRDTWWVACICEGGPSEPIEVPASSL